MEIDKKNLTNTWHHIAAGSFNIIGFIIDDDEEINPNWSQQSYQGNDEELNVRS